MELPKVIEALLLAQKGYDSQAYSECFSETATVHDEGNIHNGKIEILRWNEHTNTRYKTKLEPISYSGTGNQGILTVKVSGEFEGSPITLEYHFEFTDERIQSLQIL